MNIKKCDDIFLKFFNDNIYFVRKFSGKKCNLIMQQNFTYYMILITFPLEDITMGSK